MVPIALDWRLASADGLGAPLDAAAQEQAQGRTGFKEWADVCSCVDEAMANLQLRFQAVIEELEGSPFDRPPPFSRMLVQLFVESELAAAQLQDPQVKRSPASICDAELSMLAAAQGEGKGDHQHSVQGNHHHSVIRTRPPRVYIKGGPQALPRAHELLSEAPTTDALETSGGPDLLASHEENAAMRVPHDVLSHSEDGTASDPHATLVCVSPPGLKQVRRSGSSAVWVQYGPAVLGSPPDPGQAWPGTCSNADPASGEAERCSVPVETWVQVGLEQAGEQAAQSAPSASPAALGEEPARETLQELELSLAPSVSCTCGEVLLAIYEAILDEEDLLQHGHSERLDQLRAHFWLLRKTVAAQTRSRCLEELSESQQAVAAAPPSDAPRLRLQVSRLEQQLAAVEQELAGISRTGTSVRPPLDLASHRAMAAVQNEPTRLVSSTPAAMYEQRWLVPVSREIEAQALEGHAGIAGMVQAASTIDMLCPSLPKQLPTPWDFLDREMQHNVPKPWHDGTQPGHVNLMQEHAGHRKRALHHVAAVDLCSRSSSMSLQVRLSQGMHQSAELSLLCNGGIARCGQDSGSPVRSFQKRLLFAGLLWICSVASSLLAPWMPSLLQSSI